MRISNQKVNNLSELQELLQSLGITPLKYSIAVEGLIFNHQLEWLLMKRGKGCRDEIGKLEGVGGKFENEPDFCSSLKREILEEVGEVAKIDIIKFFEIRIDTVWDLKSNQEKNWIIISHICIYKEGQLTIMEPLKNDGFYFTSLDQVKTEALSSSARAAYKSILNERNEVEKLLKLTA